MNILLSTLSKMNPLKTETKALLKTLVMDLDPLVSRIKYKLKR